MSDDIPQSDPGLETGETGTDVSTQALTQALRGGFVILYIVIFILAGYFLASNSARVKPGASTVVLRFGRPLQTSTDEVLKEGKMVWAWPYPIDEKVDITGGARSVFSTIGWYGGATGANVQFNPDRDRYILTRDWNVLHVQMELKYTVEDPIRYNFEYEDIEKVLQLALNNAIVLSASVFEANEILDTVPVEIVDGDVVVPMVFKKAVAYHLDRLVADYDLGVDVESVEFESAPVLPRGKVAIEDAKLRQARTASFGKVDVAIEKAQTLKDKARIGAEYKISKAESEAAQLAEQVNNEFAEFNSLWDNFKDDPEGLQLELEKRLRDTVRGIIADRKVEVTQLPAGVAGGRPKVKLVVRRLPPRGPEAMAFEGSPDGGSQKAPGPN